MQVYCRGTARIRHRETGEIHEIESDELDWEIVDSDERGMGPELHHEASVDHPALGMLTWGLWEYPVGVENYDDTNVGQHEILEDFDYGLEHEMPDPDEWLDLTPPHDPCFVFLGSFRDTTDLLASHGSDDGGHLVNRLVFSHQITALETYLGDTLLNEVFADTDALQRLVDESEDLKKEKFTLSEISKDPALVKGRSAAICAASCTTTSRRSTCSTELHWHTGARPRGRQGILVSSRRPPTRLRPSQRKRQGWERAKSRS
ncbi:hypothetical protein ACH79_20000 [Bradyrhizobium sp. CCBAU 051011]|uniref:hypothetical protein n=1 Tax=Bradyrhizobium sp. CCBAU 051011 TaxID=858422 RepID=UPI0013738436|nr:hypothetical protein [Bradyrhizobium sp. CCBAU 051011]QHO74588.1 hypothetical protein ACH79_20000 [Bradyrhizobium sp. CCBAU 051011]